MLAAANAAVPRPNLVEVRDMIGKGDVVIVDVRDAPELAAGRQAQGAVNVSRGMLNSGPIRIARSTIRRFRRTRLSWSVAAPTGRAALSGNALKGARLPIHLQCRRLGRRRPEIEPV